MPDPTPIRRVRDPQALLHAARAGDRAALARLVSMVERGGVEGRAAAAQAYRAGAEPATVGVTGAPGSGKSTLTSGLIGVVRAAGTALGVLAVDPSSPFSGGAILGDRIRMQDHVLDHDVFIRSMATRGRLGGLAQACPEAIRLLGAAGLPLVIVETVGVGQVEVEVASATDTTVVVVNPGWGDSIQANKAGLLEIADIFVINKADRPGAAETRRDLEQMLDLSAPAAWRPPVLQTTAATGEGVDELWGAIERRRQSLDESGELERRRAARLEDEFRRVLTARIERAIERREDGEAYPTLLQAIREHTLDPYEAADRLLGETDSPLGEVDSPLGEAGQ